MMHRSDESGSDQRAEKIFAEYLLRCEYDPSYDADRLLADHPSLRSELAAFLSGNRVVNRGVRSGRRSDGTSTRIDEYFRKDVDPKISLDSESDELESGSPMSDRLKKLRDRGIIVDRYVLTEFIGEGGQGTVHKAWDGDLRRQVAIKFLSDVDVETTRSGLPTQQENRLARFLEEAQITAQLQHPGIPPVHELGIDERGRVYFTMKFVRGETLAKAIERHHAGEPSWSLPGLLQVVVRICETMAFAHARKVIHRDLKPQNILVGKYGEAYVMDWGLARIEGKASALDALDAQRPTVESRTIIESDRSDEAKKLESSPILTVNGQRLGTPPYMSPEQAAGEIKKIDSRTDVYALGAVLYQIYCGHPPYLPKGSRKTAIMVLDMVLEGPPTPIQKLAPNVPPEMHSIIEKAMARRAADRYPSVADLATDLKAFLEDRVVRAYPTSGWLQFKKLCKRHTRSAQLVSGLAAALAIATSAVILQQRDRAAALEQKLAAEREVADFATLALIERNDALAWPAMREMIPLLRQTITEAEGVLAERRKHSAQVDRDGEEGLVPAATERRAQAIDELLQRCAIVETSTLPSLRHRLRIAEECEMAAESSRASLWNRVLDELSHDSRFTNTAIPPHPLLVPLGRDPATGLQEFWHVQTGEEPSRDANGNLEARDGRAAIFVLIPPGEFTFGAQTGDAQSSNFDPAPPPREIGFAQPVQLVRVRAHYVSKYEFTVAQWIHATEWMPDLKASTAFLIGTPPDRRNIPIASVSYRLYARFCERLGLTLPSEIEWEFAARAGTTTRFWTGKEIASVEGNGNVLDANGRARFDSSEGETFDDGYADAAPVGSYRPNAFGLFDVIGNVAEYTSTGQDSQGRTFRYYRGGHFRAPAERCSSAYRGHMTIDNPTFNVGFRPIIRTPEDRKQ